MIEHQKEQPAATHNKLIEKWTPQAEHTGIVQHRSSWHRALYGMAKRCPSLRKRIAGVLIQPRIVVVAFLHRCGHYLPAGFAAQNTRRRRNSTYRPHFPKEGTGTIVGLFPTVSGRGGCTVAGPGFPAFRCHRPYPRTANLFTSNGCGDWPRFFSSIKTGGTHAAPAAALFHDNAVLRAYSVDFTTGFQSIAGGAPHRQRRSPLPNISIRRLSTNLERWNGARYRFSNHIARYGADSGPPHGRRITGTSFHAFTTLGYKPAWRRSRLPSGRRYPA